MGICLAFVNGFAMCFPEAKELEEVVFQFLLWRLLVLVHLVVSQQLFVQSSEEDRLDEAFAGCCLRLIR